MLVPHWSSTMCEVCLCQSLCVYVVSKNVVLEQLGFRRLSLIETDILECCIEIAEDFDGKIDSVDRRHS